MYPDFVIPSLTHKDNFAVLGDVHGKDRVLISAIEEAFRYTDLLVQVGDFSLYSSAQRKLISHHAAKNGVKVVFIPGNHENWDYLDSVSANEITSIAPHLFYAPRGTLAMIGSRKVLFFGGAYSIDRNFGEEGKHWFAQEVIDIKQACDCAENIAHTENTVDIMFTHDAPNSIDLPQECFLPGIDYFASMQAHAHREALDIITSAAQPKLLLHGHYHAFYSRTGFYSMQGKRKEFSSLGLNQEMEYGSLVLVNGKDFSMQILR